MLCDCQSKSLILVIVKSDNVGVSGFELTAHAFSAKCFIGLHPSVIQIFGTILVVISIIYASSHDYISACTCFQQIYAISGGRESIVRRNSLIGGADLIHAFGHLCQSIFFIPDRIIAHKKCCRLEPVRAKREH